MKWLNFLPFSVIPSAAEGSVPLSTREDPSTTLGMTILMVMALFSAPALAEPYTYSPEGCEFTITFPSEPFTGRKCNPDNPDQCHDVVTFTKVFDVTASLNLSVICNPAEENMYERYSGDVMKTTLIAMAGRDKLEESETGFNEQPEFKMAYILGYGKKAGQDLIYNGQLWIGKKSVFSLEADIAGDYVDGADTMFAQILQSVTLKNPPKAATDKTEKTEDNKTEEKTDAKEEDKPKE